MFFIFTQIYRKYFWDLRNYRRKKDEKENYEGRYCLTKTQLMFCPFLPAYLFLKLYFALPSHTALFNPVDVSFLWFMASCVSVCALTKRLVKRAVLLEKHFFQQLISFWFIAYSYSKKQILNIFFAFRFVRFMLLPVKCGHRTETFYDIKNINFYSTRGCFQFFMSFFILFFSVHEWCEREAPVSMQARITSTEWPTKWQMYLVDKFFGIRWLSMRIYFLGSIFEGRREKR